MPENHEPPTRSLSLSINDATDAPDGHQSTSLPWLHRQSKPYERATILPSKYSRYRDSILDASFSIYEQAGSSFRRLSRLQRILVAFGSITCIVLGILFLVFNERIFAALAPIAERWSNIRGGWMILWAATFIVSFPPMIGYSSCATLAGFVYGFPNGWPILASATIVGSTVSFLTSRYLLSSMVHRLLATDTRFAALSHTIEHSGFKLLVMIRFCPLPYSLSNGAIATFPAVHWANFLLATALVSPKLLIHTFIGSRLKAIGDSGGTMDAKTKALNYASIAFGVLLGVVTGWFIYRKTKQRARELAEEEGVLEGRAEGNRRPKTRRVFTDDPEQAHLTPGEVSVRGRSGDDVRMHGHDEDADDFSDLSDEDVFRLGDGDLAEAEHRPQRPK